MSLAIVIPSQGIKVNKQIRTISIPCLKLSFEYEFPNNFEKINQIEVDQEYAYIAVTVEVKETKQADKYIGVDLNTTGHAVVVANPKTGGVWKLGKKAEHIHKKYKSIRRDLQKRGRYKKVKQVKNRESRIVRNLNHKMSKKIVEIAENYDCGIKLEKLEGIRSNTRHSKSFRYSLNSWSFYQLQKMVEYKAKLRGIQVAYIEPEYTSKTCSICGHVGYRNGKHFMCPCCGHIDHADVNAAFNIALRQIGVGQFSTDRDVLNGSTDTPKGATVRMQQTPEPLTL